MRCLLPLLSLVLACSGETLDSGDDTPSDTALGGVPAITPVEGSYITEATTGDNSCGAQAALPAELTGVVSSSTNESYDFLLEWTDDSLQFSCTLGDGALSCSAEGSDDYASWGWDAVLNFSHEMTGSWLSATEFEGELSSTTECVGSECSELAEVTGGTFPCTVIHTVSGMQN